MSVYRRSTKNKLSYVLILFVAVLIAALILFAFQLSIHIDDICRYESKMLAVKMINSAVGESLPESLQKDLIVEKCDQNGAIQSLSLDQYKADKLNTIITDAVAQKFEKSVDEEFTIPIGTLSGISFLSGRGFDISLRFHRVGSVRTEINSEFVSCGINQSKYRAFVNITLELGVILSFKTIELTVDYQYLLGEKIIVGKVPNTYFSA